MYICLNVIKNTLMDTMLTANVINNLITLGIYIADDKKK